MYSDWIEGKFRSLIGKIHYTEAVPTACISADAGLLINPKWWASLNSAEKEFVKCHEVLHVLLKHHSRFPMMTRSNNVACDLAINSFLRDVFCVKTESEIISTFPTLSTSRTFPCMVGLPEGKSAEWYLEAIENSNGIDNFTTWGTKIGCKEGKEFEKNQDGLVNESMAGVKYGLGSSKILNDLRDLAIPRIKMNLSKFVTNETAGKIWKKYRFDYAELFGFPDRRNYLIDNELLLPSSVWREDVSPVKKPNALILIDTSGSCTQYVDKFWSIYKSIPATLFNKFPWGFNSTTYPIDPDNPKYKSGGTSFEDFRNLWMKICPDVTFVITDGEAPRIEFVPSPSTWWWFITKNGHIGAVPKECNVEWLSSFVEDL